MTPRQRDLLGYIHSFTSNNDGVAPSFDQMKAHLNLASKSGIHRLVTALERRGLINKAANRARAIVITDRGIAALTGSLVDKPLEDTLNQKIARKFRLEAHKFKFHSGADTLQIMAGRLEKGEL
ncbi:MAG: hypothetical protein AAGK93_00545 [Pseudomonadota bacterium]